MTPQPSKELVPEQMSDAEATIKYAIFDALVSNWHKKDQQTFAEDVRNAIFDKIFEPHLIWAVEEYIDQLKKRS